MCLCTQALQTKARGGHKVVGFGLVVVPPAAAAASAFQLSGRRVRLPRRVERHAALQVTQTPAGPRERGRGAAVRGRGDGERRQPR